MTVTVVDTTKPVLSVPANGSVFLTDQTITVQYNVTDVCDANPTVVVTPSNPIVAPHEVGSILITVTATDASGNIGTSSVTVNVKALAATIDFDPNTLNQKDKGQWVTVYIEAPQGYSASGIDGSTVSLFGVPAYIGKEGWAKAGATGGNVADFDGDGKLERMVKFDRAAIITALNNGNNVPVVVIGKVNGFWFEGTDYIRVIK
jgi:hypothetical protein